MTTLFFLLDYYPPHRGGIENVFDNLIFRLLKKNYHIILLTSRFDARLPKVEHKGNLTIYRIGRGRKSFFFHAFWVGAKILRKNKQISVIHSSTYTSAIPASILGTLFKKKKILTIHEIFGKLRTTFKPRYSRRIFQLFEWITFRFTHDGYHCVSVYTLNSVRIHYGLPDNTLHLAYNGVDMEFWDAEKVSEATKRERRKRYGREGKFLMLYYGHSGKSKGLDYLVVAIPEIVKQNPDGMLIFNLIAAKRDKEMKHRILQQAKKSGFPEHVQLFDGWEPDELRELVACADVVIAPSLAEGFGSVHSEACAMGKPLITTQVAAIPEVVSGHIVFVQAGSSEAIIQGIQKVRTGAGERIMQKHFDWDETIEKIETLYHLG